MSVNGITGATSTAYESYAKAEKKNAKEKTETKQEKSAVYEASDSEKSQKRTEIINKMKTDLDAHTTQLQNIVQQLITKQGSAYGTANSIWSFLAGGNVQADPATIAQAQADIAEDGYWGVEATSDRIVDFAKALAQDNPDMIEKMRDAFQKGFDQATKTWGGKLPEISQKTYSAVMDKLDAWAQSSDTKTE